MVYITDDSVPVSILVSQPQVLFSDGFEESDDSTFNFAKWTGRDLSTPDRGNTVSYSQDNAHHGMYSYKSMVLAGGTGNTAWCNIYKSININPVYVRLYVLIDRLAVNGQSVRFCSVSESTGGRYSCCYFGQKNNVGQAQWIMRPYTNGAFYEYTGPNCSINQLYCVEGAFFRDNAGAGWAKMWVNGIQILDVTGLTTSRGLNYVGVGHVFSNAELGDTSIYSDCVAINDQPIGQEA